MTQQKTLDKRINVRRNKKNQVVLYDTDEVIRVSVENLKQQPATLILLQHIPGQWDMAECNMKYTKKDAYKIILGPSTPMTEILFDYGINALCGSYVEDNQLVENYISQAVPFKFLKGVKHLTLLREGGN